MISEIASNVIRFESEVLEVYKTIVLPGWNGKMHGLHQTLYGYMMLSFSYIDLLSALFNGGESGNQTERMLKFMNEYIRNCPEENMVSLQVWRHKLMHTSSPRSLAGGKDGKEYYWLLQWCEHVPENQHFTFSETEDRKILNIGLIYLIRDIRRAIASFEKELVISTALREKYNRHCKNIQSYKFRQYKF